MEALRQQLTKKIEAVSAENFEALALEVFAYQALYNPLYAQYLHLLGINPAKIQDINAIPCLPIQFFKNFSIQTGIWSAADTFSSSGTTATTTSQHLVRDPDFYLRNARRGFQHFYGALNNYCVLALLPSYLERAGSSLVAMAADFIQQSGHEKSGFFLHDIESMIGILEDLKKSKKPVLLLSVSFALLDLAERFPMDLSHAIVMETGGMKGKRKELVREELHEILCQAFRIEAVHAEYGMTELFSQAYSTGKGLFRATPTMHVYTRQITDPFSPERIGKTGALNIIDLANIDSISFIATDDLGRIYDDQSFEVLGRLDNSDIRGCNLLFGD